MLKYKRVSSPKGTIRYEYYPEGDLTKPGIIEFQEGDKPKIVKESENDVKGYYAVHAIRGIDIGKENGTVAWY